MSSRVVNNFILFSYLKNSNFAFSIGYRQFLQSTLMLYNEIQLSVKYDFPPVVQMFLLMLLTDCTTSYNEVKHAIRLKLILGQKKKQSYN